MLSILALISCLPMQPAYVHEPFGSYSKHIVDGFAVYVSKAAADHPETTGPAMSVMRDQLDKILQTVPTEALKTLRSIPIFIDQNDPKFPCACYHTSADWLKENGYIPQKAHSVQIANTRNFVDWIAKAQPSMVLHEMAHGYHDIKFGYDDRYIAACYKLAVAARNYESVSYVNGGKRRHYALTNPMEYFAETTEAYFGKNDFFPFDRRDLKAADPAGYAMIERLWGVRKSTSAD